jgi:RNA polymerase sigma factor (sigma-70 family)
MDAEVEQAKTLGLHRTYLLRYALFHLRDPSLAEDAVQDTLIAALAQRDSFQGRSQLRTWLTAILKHKIIDLVRKRARGLPVVRMTPRTARSTHEAGGSIPPRTGARQTPHSSRMISGVSTRSAARECRSGTH